MPKENEEPLQPTPTQKENDAAMRRAQGLPEELPEEDKPEDVPAPDPKTKTRTMEAARDQAAGYTTRKSGR